MGCTFPDHHTIISPKNITWAEHRYSTAGLLQDFFIQRHSGRLMACTIWIGTWECLNRPRTTCVLFMAAATPNGPVTVEVLRNNQRQGDHDGTNVWRVDVNRQDCPGEKMYTVKCSIFEIQNVATPPNVTHPRQRFPDLHWPRPPQPPSAPTPTTITTTTTTPTATATTTISISICVVRPRPSIT